ncbi:MAG: hypothetical protein M0025_08845 [Elusimicrobia bacterium]|nr:hypothetical protein [Elusimicrobiota bacterium]
MEKTTQAHMCDMAGKKENWEELKSAAGARWICSACGRAAAEPERLCAPETLGPADGKAPGPGCCGH